MRTTFRAARILNRRRRLVAVVLAAMATVFVGLAVRPPPTSEVLTAAHDLKGGVLSASDVTTAHLPETAIPDGALRPGASITGRVLAAPARRGEPLTDLRLLGPSLVDAYGPGMRATPVRVTDAGAARLLRPGDVIDVIASTASWEDAAPNPLMARVAQAVTVIAIPNSTRPTDSMTENGALVVLATTPDQAARLAQAGTGSRLSITIHGHPG
ncbi:Flp pilus assembly protein CpaB [Sphaerisporangium corydalis]|uniref:Flp pilus assembly protein CpaB n=2 Tax=Sphaerisporangium corydalis TaxID=1441875 RepID=A0ABV9ERB9_9ACTN